MTVSANAPGHQTRQQRMMAMAISHAEAVKAALDNKPPKEHDAADIYGVMCHKLPVLIRSCGLCQAVSFVEAKAGNGEGDRERAHSMLRDHIREVLASEGLVSADGPPSTEIRDMDLERYALATRTLLRAWLFHKRFAESILGATAESDR